MIGIVLIGPMGSGKTTVAQHLAARTAAVAADSDAAVEQLAGKPVSDVFVDEGEAVFRALERRAIRTMLQDAAENPAPQVIALGGGAVLDQDTQADLQALRRDGALVVFLDIAPGAATKRVGLGVGRPLLAVNPRATWIRLFEQRRHIYQRLAALVVDTSELSPDAVAERILAELPSADSPATPEPAP